MKWLSLFLARTGSAFCLEFRRPSTLSLRSVSTQPDTDLSAEIERLVFQKMQENGKVNSSTTSSGSSNNNNKRAAESLAKRKFILQELLETERDYVKDLQSIVEGYIPLTEQTPRPPDLEGKEKIVFGNIIQIFEWHRDTFLPEIEKNIEDCDETAKLFVKYERRMLMYVKYCENKPKSEFLVGEHIDGFFEKMRAQLGHRLTLPDLLIKPVQRIMKYQLLLRDMLKCNDRAGEPTDTLRKALDVMTRVPKAADDMMNIGRLQGFDGKITAQGKLLLQDNMQVTEQKEGTATKLRDWRVFLFEQIVMFSEVVPPKKPLNPPTYIYKGSIKLNKMSLEQRMEGGSHQLILNDRTPGNNQKIVCQARDEEQHQRWVQNIQAIIDIQTDFLRALQSPIAYQQEKSKTSDSIASPSSSEPAMPVSAATPVDKELCLFATVLQDYTANKEDEITVQRGDRVEILAATSSEGRFLVHRPGTECSPPAEGWLPAHIVQLAKKRDSTIEEVRWKQGFEDQYEITEEIAHGRYSCVYACVDRRKPRQPLVAKFLLKGIRKREQFDKEYQLLREAAKCNHIVQALDQFEVASAFVLVLEHAGSPLIRAILDSQSLSERLVADWMQQLLRALHFLYSRGIVHRAVRPENLILGDNLLRLADFSDAGRLGEATEDDDDWEFAAPERVRGEALSPASDIWSLGVVMVLLLTGVSPFWSDGGQEKLRESVIKAELSTQGLSSASRSLVTSVLRVNPRERSSAAVALRHSWFPTASSQSLSKQLPLLAAFLQRRETAPR